MNMRILSSTAAQPSVLPSNPVDFNFRRVLDKIPNDSKQPGVVQNEFQVLRQILANPNNVGKISPESLMEVITKPTLMKSLNQSVVRLAVAHLHATTSQEFHQASKIPASDLLRMQVGLAARDIQSAIEGNYSDPRQIHGVDRHLRACEALAQTGNPIGYKRLEDIAAIDITKVIDPAVRTATSIMMKRAEEMLAELPPKR